MVRQVLQRSVVGVQVSGTAQLVTSPQAVQVLGGPVVKKPVVQEVHKEVLSDVHVIPEEHPDTGAHNVQTVAGPAVLSGKYPSSQVVH